MDKDSHLTRARFVSLYSYYLAQLMVVLLSVAGCQSSSIVYTEEPVPTIEASTNPPTTEEVTLESSELTVIQFEERQGYIPNPGMGWQDTNRYERRFPETVGYDRFNWDLLNPARGSYDWSLIETLRGEMKDVDGQFSFRVRTSRPPPFGPGQVMPVWLLNEGVALFEESDYSTEPLYSDCLFLDAHAEFVEALRERYDGDPDLAFIDVGSYGYYGEWDSEQYQEEPESLDWHARRRIIDMYLGGSGTRPCQAADGEIQPITYDYLGFQQTQLIMPYTPWFEDSLMYAVSKRQDIGIRQDSLGSASHQTRYREAIGWVVQERWLNAPIVFEFAPEEYTSEGLARALAFAQEMHATFVHDNFDGQGTNSEIDEVLETIGYRLFLSQITYNQEVQSSTAIDFEMLWQNTGAALAYGVDLPLVLALMSEGDLVATHQIDADLPAWMPGQMILLSGEFPVPSDIPPGSYDFTAGFVDPLTGMPVLKLAVETWDEEGWYYLGPVEVLP